MVQGVQGSGFRVQGSGFSVGAVARRRRAARSGPVEYGAPEQQAGKDPKNEEHQSEGGERASSGPKAQGSGRIVECIVEDLA